MIYPKKINAKKTGYIIKGLLIVSVVIAVVLYLLNRFLTPNMHWAALCNVGIIYIWITVWYATNKNTNIAAHVMIQTIVISVLMVYIDYLFGNQGWSINIALPIIIIIANVTMLILTIVSNRRYIRYAIFQLIILLFSMLPALLLYEHYIDNKVLSYIALAISGLNLVLTITLSAKDVKDEIIRKFHL